MKDKEKQKLTFEQECSLIANGKDLATGVEKIFNEVITKIKERFEQTKGYTTCYDVVFALTELAKQYGVEIKE